MATERGRPVKLSKKYGGTDFGAAILKLREAIGPFAQVTALWRARERSVQVFGH